jgi:hypothetical protein
MENFIHKLGDAREISRICHRYKCLFLDVSGSEENRMMYLKKVKMFLCFIKHYSTRTYGGVEA